MIKIYQAKNGAEAQLILNLFHQAGIAGRIDGEYLQGGIGELQPCGLISLLINSSDKDKAKEILRQWDAKEDIQLNLSGSGLIKDTIDLPSFKPLKLRHFFLICFVFIIFSAIVFYPSGFRGQCFPTLSPSDYALLNLNSGVLKL